MDSTYGNDMETASGDGPIVRFRDLVTVGEDAAARHLIGSDIDTGERVAIVVARPLADASPGVARAHADARIAAAQRAVAEPVEGMAPVRAVGRTPGGHPFSVSALGDGKLGGELLADEEGVPTDRAIEILLGAARALASAHAAGRSHGSIGPNFLIVGADGGVSLHGFGIAMPLDRQAVVGDEMAALARRDDVRALARMGRALFSDGRRTGRRMGVGVPAAVAALIARAESADPTLTARELALGLEDAAHERGAGPFGTDGEGVVIPAASAYDSSRWTEGRRPMARIAVAVAAALALLLLFGDFVRRASGDPEPVRTAQGAQPAVPSEELGAVYDSLAPDTAPSAPAATRPLAPPRGGVRQAERDASPAPSAPPPANVPGRASDASRKDAVLGAIPAGAVVRLLSGERVCTNTHAPGDRFPATVAAAVESADGAVLPAGSSAMVEVTSVDRSESADDPASIGLRVRQVTADGVAYPIVATIASASVEQGATASRASDAGKVVGGAVAGAILGQVLGGDTRSTVIGAATGAAAGTAIALGTRDRAGCIPHGGAIAIRLERPLRIPVP